MKQPAEARAAYEYLVKNFPDTDAGRLAKQGLDRMSRVAKP